MTSRIDLFYNTYGNFDDRILDAIRKDTYGTDIGQNSWVTVDEYERLVPQLDVGGESHVLEVASGSGGPAVFLSRMTGCRVTGIDANELGVENAGRTAERAGAAGRVGFRVADATAPLPFEDGTFDAMLCIDSMNHFPNRLAVFREWRRVLRPGGRGLFTDPVEISGLVTNDELALRSSIGLFVFAPAGHNERLIEEAGLRLVHREDVTANAALTSGRWHDARERRRADLVRIEGEERFEGLQKFFRAVHDLTRERRLSRVAYVVERPAG